MKLQSLILILFAFFLISGCTQEGQNEQDSNLNDVKIDKNTNLSAEVGDAKVEIQDSKAKVEYANKTIVAENVSLTVNEEGVYEVNLSINNEINLPSNIPIQDWCIAGKTYDVKDASGATSTSIIIGIEEYKNKIYCKAESKTNVYDIKIITTYYFDYGAKDVWALVNIGDIVNEVHINNN